jgi:DNA-binding beta-propeller fold protein YncE
MSGEDKAETRLRELLRDPRWSLPTGPDPEQRVRRAAGRQRLRLAGIAGVAGVAVIAVAAAIPAGLGAFGQPPRPEQPPAAPTLYIYSSGVGSNHAKVVTPVNTATNTPGKPIHVGVAGPWPAGMIVFTPDGKTAYVSTAPGPITPINTATGTPGKPIRIRKPSNGPDLIVITPDGKTAYVAERGSLSPTVTPVNTATGTPGKPINIRGGFPLSYGQIVFTPDGKTAYVTTWSGTIIPINTATNAPGKPIHVGGGAFGIAITPDGKTAYVTTGSGVTPINTATNAPGKPINIGDGRGIVITPDGKTAYVTTINGCRTDAEECPYTVTPISTATGTPGTPIHVGFNPDFGGEVVFTPDGKTAYVTSQNGCRVTDHRCTYTVTPISTATGTPGKPIPVGFGPDTFTPEIVITPDGKTAYVTTGSGVTPISTATNTPGKPIHVVGSTFGHAIAITP